MHKNPKSARKVFFCIFAFLMVLPGVILATGPPALTSGQTVYVPVYSNVYSGPKANEFQLAALVSIRNIDPKNSITILRADYYDNDGRIVENYIQSPKTLGPLASTHIYIKEYNTKGGPGANFIIKWEASKPVNEPIIESLMLGLKGGQGVSFVCPAKVINTQD